MQVAKYWRNKKLRYRLVRSAQVVQRGAEPSNVRRNEAVANQATAKRELAGIPS